MDSDAGYTAKQVARLKQGAKDPLRSAVPVLLDWRRYFHEFCMAHGGSPDDPASIVERGEWLVFRDGWRYSNSRYSGPELPPPSDPAERRELILFYWQRRRDILKLNYRELKERLLRLESLQAQHSMPLQQVVAGIDDAGQRLVSRVGVDLELLQVRLRLMKEDLAECDERLSKLSAIRSRERQ